MARFEGKYLSVAIIKNCGEFVAELAFSYEEKLLAR